MKMRKRTREALRRRSDEFCRAVSDLFDCEAVYSNKATMVIRGRPKVPVDILHQIANSRLNPDGYHVRCEGAGDKYVLTIDSSTATRRFPWVNLILFIATIASVLVTAAVHASQGEVLNDWSQIWSGAPFTFWLMAILLFHEFGHYTFSRLRGVDVSLPYFIPAPLFFFLGTLGAVIKSRSPIKNRRDLLDVAAAGPIAGFIVAIPAIIIGLANSEIVELEGLAGYSFGRSFVYSVLANMMIGPVPEGHTILLHPIALAGIFGLLVTMLNLLPMGSLDGGHIAYALFGKHQRYISYATIAVLALLSLWWQGWLIWVGLILIMGPVHPPTLFDEIKVGKWRRLIGYICIVIFLLCFIPIPISVIN